MQNRKLLALSLLTLLFINWSVAIINASTMTVTIKTEKISVELSLSLYQNVTSFPSLKEPLTGTSAQELTTALEQSLKIRVGNASVSSLSGQVSSNSDWINATIQFDVSGISSRKGDNLVVNCSWIPLRIDRDLRVGDLNYNLVGATYLRPAFEEYQDFQKAPMNETILEVMYLTGPEAVVNPETAINRAGNVTFLDLRNLDYAIQEWRRTYNLTTDKTTWSYNPGTAEDLTMTVVPREEPPFSGRVQYAYEAAVSVDGAGQAEKYAISLDAYGGQKILVMSLVMAATFALAVAATLLYRSRRKRMLRRRK